MKTTSPKLQVELADCQDTQTKRSRSSPLFFINITPTRPLRFRFRHSRRHPFTNHIANIAEGWPLTYPRKVPTPRKIYMLMHTLRYWFRHLSRANSGQSPNEKPSWRDAMSSL